MQHFYIREKRNDENLHPIVIVAMKKDGDYAIVSRAICHPKDQWNKKFALNRSYGLLNSAKAVRIHKDQIKNEELIWRYIDDIISVATRNGRSIFDIQTLKAKRTFISQLEKLFQQN